MMADNKLNLVVQFSALDKLSGAMKNIIGLGKSGGQVLGQMKGEAKKLDSELAKVRQEMSKATGNITDLANRERDLEVAIAKSNSQLQRQKKLLEIDSKVSKITAQGERLKSAGASNAAGGVGILASLALAGRGAMDFSSGMVDIQQKANLTNRETSAMARNILVAAEAAHQMPEDMRAGVDTLAGLGLDARVGAQMIGSLGRLGTAFKVDIADGANTAFANLNNLKVAVADTGRALDIMAAGGNAGAFEVKDMAKHFPGLTAQMQALGQKGLPAVADMTAALQIARRGAGDADEAGNNIKNLLAKINSPGTINAFRKNFGVELPAALKKAYAQGKTPMEALADITKKATGGDLSKIGFAVEDMQAQSALRSLILNMDDYRKIRGDIAKSDGTIDAAFQQRELQDASVAWKSFLGTSSALGITLGTTVLPAVTSLFRQINVGVSAVSRWAQANPEVARSMITMIAVSGALKLGIGALQFAFGGILGPLGKAWGLFQKYRTLGSITAAFPNIARAFVMLRTAALFMGRGVMQAGMMMMANPMVLAIVAIVAVVGVAAYLIYSNWGKISAAFSAGFAAVKNGWQALSGFFSNIGGQMVSIGTNIIHGIAAGIMAAPGAVWNALKSVVMSGVTGVKNLLGIKSPSRLFMAMGGHITSGLALGVDRGGSQPLRSMSRLASGIASAGALAMAGPSMAAGSGRPATGGAPAAAPITINITQLPGEDAEAFANRVIQLLEAKKRTARLSSYDDEF